MVFLLCKYDANIDLMACSRCTGPGTGQGMGNDGFLYYTMSNAAHTTQGQGQGQQIIVFYCVHPAPCPCPVPSPVQCV